MTKLKDVSGVITKGTTPTSIGKNFTSSGINFIKSESITNSKYLKNDCYEYIDDETNEQLKRSQLKNNDLLFSIAGAYLGKIAIVQEEDLPANTNQAVGIVRLDNDKVNNNFLYYYFSQKHITAYINKLSSQSSQPNLNLALLGSLEYKSINLSEQQKIANILSTLDAKIELNNKINTELEAMAKTLYDYWFVQFDFPNAKGKPYKSSGGKMVYSEELKREIPEGWGMKILEDIESNIITGKTPPKANKNYFDGEIPFITIGDIRGNTFIIDTDETLTKLGADYQKTKYLKEGAICVSCIASPGLVGIVTELSQTNQQINSVECEKEENRYYLYFALIDLFKASKAKTGNTFPNMNKGDFSAIEFLYPEKRVLNEFHTIVHPIFKKILNNQKQTQTLKAQRDFLLPMLMNGQVSVK